MAEVAVVLLDVHELHVDDVDRRVVLTVNDILLQRGVDLGIGQRSNIAAQRVERGNRHIGVLDADLEALHIVSRLDFADVVGQSTGAQVREAEHIEAGLVGLFLIELVQYAVRVTGDLVGLIVVIEQERQAEEGELIVIRGENVAVAVGDLDRAAADYIDCIFRAAQLTVGVELDSDAALRLGLNVFLERLETSVDGAVDDLIVGDDHLISFGTVVGFCVSAGTAAGS